jgi:hypothetical protein
MHKLWSLQEIAQNQISVFLSGLRSNNQFDLKIVETIDQPWPW